MGLSLARSERDYVGAGGDGQSRRGLLYGCWQRSNGNELFVWKASAAWLALRRERRQADIARRQRRRFDELVGVRNFCKPSRGVRESNQPVRLLPWTALPELEGDPETLKTIDEAEALLESLRNLYVTESRYPRSLIEPLLVRTAFFEATGSCRSGMSGSPLGTAPAVLFSICHVHKFLANRIKQYCASRR